MITLQFKLAMMGDVIISSCATVTFTLRQCFSTSLAGLILGMSHLSGFEKKILEKELLVPEKPNLPNPILTPP